MVHSEAGGGILDWGVNLINANVSHLKTVVVSEEDGPELEGYPTRHVTLRTDYSGTGSLLFVKFNYRIEEHDEIWTTEALERPEIEAGWREAATKTGNEFLNEHARIWNENTPGVILKHTNVIRLINVKKGETEEKTEHLVVRNVSELKTSDINPGVFAMPACEMVEKSELKDQSKRMLKQYIK